MRNIKQLGCVISLLILSACKQQSPTASIDERQSVLLRAPYVLKSSPFRDEFLEAEINFMAPGVLTQRYTSYHYELQIRNNIGTPFTLERLDVVDPASPNNSLKTYTGEQLGEIFDRPGFSARERHLELTGNSSGVANLTLSIPKDIRIGEVFHRLTFGNGDAGNDKKFVFEVARRHLPSPTSLVLSPPVEPGDWAYFTIGHRNTRQLIEGAPIYPQRFALDLAMVGPEGRFAKDQTQSNESYITYGQNVLAVKDGVVLAVMDGLAENDLATGDLAFRMTRETGRGNYVLLDIGGGLNAFYAHLIPGSLQVKPGDAVKRGDVLGKLGNSGNSDAPHLHLHIEQASPLYKPTSGEGMPFLFDRATEIDRFSPAELEHIFETDTLLGTEIDPTTEPDDMFLQNGLIRFE